MPADQGRTGSPQQDTDIEDVRLDPAISTMVALLGVGVLVWGLFFPLEGTGPFMIAFAFAFFAGAFFLRTLKVAVLDRDGFRIGKRSYRYGELDRIEHATGTVRFASANGASRKARQERFVIYRKGAETGEVVDVMNAKGGVAALADKLNAAIRAAAGQR